MKFDKSNEDLREKARFLRKNSTLSEVLLWNELKNGKLSGLNFNRQKVINNRYILDFYCPAANLAIEIDGVSHDNKLEYDIERHNYLSEIGITVLHFDDLYVKNDIGWVLRKIEDAVAASGAISISSVSAL